MAMLNNQMVIISESKPNMTIQSGWWFQPLWKIWVRQLGLWYSQYMESHKIHVPNHQPAVNSNFWDVATLNQILLYQGLSNTAGSTLFTCSILQHTAAPFALPLCGLGMWQASPQGRFPLPNSHGRRENYRDLGVPEVGSLWPAAHWSCWKIWQPAAFSSQCRQYTGCESVHSSEVLRPHWCGLSQAWASTCHWNVMTPSYEPWSILTIWLMVIPSIIRIQK